MKREEKNQQTRRRILDRAMQEFAEQGYGSSSVNTICSGEGISKGIIYHYFETKDALYLSCVEECFKSLTEFLKNSLVSGEETVSCQMTAYFNARFEFFQENPLYQKIFCEAVVMPPAHLASEVQRRRADFDALNISVLNRILEPIELRDGITREQVVEMFRQFQDFFHVKYQPAGAIDFETHEEDCRRALDILLYGVVKKRC